MQDNSVKRTKTIEETLRTWKHSHISMSGSASGAGNSIFLASGYEGGRPVPSLAISPSHRQCAIIAHVGQVMQLEQNSRTRLSLGLPPDCPPDFDEQSCVNRSYTDEKSFYELEAGLLKEFVVK